MKQRVLIACTAWCAATACGGSAIFGDIGTNMANPLTVAVNSVAQRAYINNSNDKFLFTGGSLHVVNLATITAPTRVGVQGLGSFSGQLFLDVANQRLYATNRLSDNDDDKTDALLAINVNEANTAFLSVSSVDAAGDPFGVVQGNSATQLLVPTREGLLDVYDTSSGAPVRTTQVDLKVAVDDGSTLQIVQATEAVVINGGAQAVVTRSNGGLLVVNLNEAGVGGAFPVDYWIDDLQSPRGLATPGGASTTVYVVDTELNSADVQVPYFRVLNLAQLTPDTGNTTAHKIDKDGGALQTSQVEIGKNPQQVIFSASRNRIYTTNMDADAISVLDAANPGTVLATIAVGDEPFGLALYQQVAGTDTHLLVCNRQSNTVSIIDLATNTIIATYP